MDLKRISWVGNMCQKFETMCMEVEETLYEDTVQYVENQARTVGACLRKFYSDVMQDLLPETCIYPMKTETLEHGLSHCADVIAHGRLKAVAKKEPVELKKSLPQDAVDDQWSDWNWEQNETCPGFILNSRRNSPSPERSNQTTHVAEETGIECRDSLGEDGATKIRTLGPDCASVSEGKEVNCKEAADTEGCVASIPFDSPVLNMKLDEIGAEGVELLEPPNGSLLSELDDAAGRPSCLDEIKADDSEDAGLVVSLSLDSTCLLESCVLVDINEQCHVSQSQGKQRSYKVILLCFSNPKRHPETGKALEVLSCSSVVVLIMLQMVSDFPLTYQKKFRDAFSPCKWSKSKEHHEQPSGDLRRSLLAASTTYSEKRNSEALDSCESEWELL